MKSVKFSKVSNNSKGKNSNLVSF